MIKFLVIVLLALSCGKQTNPKPNFLDSKKVPEKKEQEEKPEQKEIEECLLRAGRCIEGTGDYIEAKCTIGRSDEDIITRHQIAEVCDIIPCYANRDYDCIENSKRYVKTLIFCCIPTE